MKWIKTLQSKTALIALAAAVCIFPLVAMAKPQTDNTQAAAGTVASISTVQLTGDGSKAELLVTTSVPVTYTSYKTITPARLVVDFSQTVPVDSLALPKAKMGAVKSVSVKRYDTDAGPLTRMEVELNQDVDAEISPMAGNASVLKFSFPAVQQPVVETPVAQAEPVSQPPAAVAAAVPTEVKQTSAQPVAQPAVAPPATSARLFSGVSAHGNYIEIQLSGPSPEFKTFRLNKPERVVLDILDTRVATDTRLVQINTLGVATARIGTYADKVRVVFDASNGSLPDAVVERFDSGLKVSFPGSIAKAPSLPAATTVETSSKPSYAPSVAKNTAVASLGAPIVESLDFQYMDTVSRVVVKLRGDVITEEPVKSSGFVSMKFKNASLPRHLQRSFETRDFNSPVLRITPIEMKTRKGHDTVVRVALKSDVKYKFVHEADIAYLEFQNPPKQVNAPVQKTSQSSKASPQAVSVEQQLVQNEPVKQGARRSYTGRKVTLEFADAEVRKIFQLLSEVSNKNFVLGDEVSGTISLKLVNVPWDQALDIILDTKNLDKREEANIVLIRGKGKFKSLLDEEVEIRKAALKSEPLVTETFDVNYSDLPGIAAQFNALKTDRGSITQDARTNKIIAKDVKTALDDMRKLLKALDVPEKQVMIEARIVEATTDFTKSLGINWGIHRTATSDSAWPFINTLHSAFGGVAATAAPTTGVSGNSGATADVAFGLIGTNVKINMRLNAAATAGIVRVISTPKVATLNNKTAKITQGTQIPYTSATSDKIETKFVEAALALEVTPHINNNGTIVMKIDAKNDSPGSTGNPPPINKKQATTEMLLRDGETTVIGGIYKDQESEGEEGVPWLKDVPLLGHLFKNTDIKKQRTELLIFITPHIINPTAS